MILVHGLWMHGAVFAIHGRWLRREGFVTRSFSYPSVRRGVAENADRLSSFVAAMDAPSVHLVGHSLGGLIVLAMLEGQAQTKVRRAVLMGAPVRGSHCARALLRHALGASIIGPAWTEWRPEQVSHLPPQVDIGVLAGTRSVGFAKLIGGLTRPNDGVVALEETRFEQARDSIAIDVAHSQMLVSRVCASQVAAFLRTGKFLHDGRA